MIHLWLKQANTTLKQAVFVVSLLIACMQQGPCWLGHPIQIAHSQQHKKTRNHGTKSQITHLKSGHIVMLSLSFIAYATRMKKEGEQDTS